MTLPDPLWIQYQYVQERAEAHARRRQIRRQLPERHSPAAVWLGAGFITVGDRMVALGGRLCPSCPGPDVAIESGATQ